MNAKRFVSEPLILVFVAVVDLASVTALVLCHRDMSVKQSEAAAVELRLKQQPVHPELPDTRLHYSPEALNTLLHPVAGKLKDIAHPEPVSEGSAAVPGPVSAEQ